MSGSKMESFREFVKFFAVEIPTALIGIAVLIAIGWAAGSMANSETAYASVGPRPTVELVKTFKCWAENNACPSSIENEANAWLKEIKLSGRVVERKLKVTERHIVLVIFYEVLEWRTPSSSPQKQPAEKP